MDIRLSATYGHGDMERWTLRQQDMDMETWSHGYGDMDKETWTWSHGHGDMDFFKNQMENESPGDFP
jgi:hypothetical protein